MQCTITEHEIEKILKDYLEYRYGVICSEGKLDKIDSPAQGEGKVIVFDCEFDQIDDDE